MTSEQRKVFTEWAKDLKEEGVSNEDIAKNLGLTESEVRYLLNDVNQKPTITADGRMFNFYIDGKGISAHLIDLDIVEGDIYANVLTAEDKEIKNDNY